MKELLFVAGGGAMGAISRYLVFVAAANLFGSSYPFGTLIVNVVGSFLLGVVAEGAAIAWTIPPQAQLFIVVGFLGAFTTFSTFSLNVAVLYERGEILVAALYIMASVILSVGGLFAGLFVVRRLLAPVI